jgi:hypothetical protein
MRNGNFQVYGMTGRESCVLPRGAARTSSSVTGLIIGLIFLDVAADASGDVSVPQA